MSKEKIDAAYMLSFNFLFPGGNTTQQLGFFPPPNTVTALNIVVQCVPVPAWLGSGLASSAEGTIKPWRPATREGDWDRAGRGSDPRGGRPHVACDDACQVLLDRAADQSWWPSSSSSSSASARCNRRIGARRGRSTTPVTASTTPMAMPPKRPSTIGPAPAHCGAAPPSPYRWSLESLVTNMTSPLVPLPPPPKRAEHRAATPP